VPKGVLKLTAGRPAVDPKQGWEKFRQLETRGCAERAGTTERAVELSRARAGSWSRADFKANALSVVL
jgi:hypothetical protein